ncbi:MAG: FAD-binding oxidoreductase, partial [Halioglobus sp.]|nr:FAD-binding oxidoreductase [Halioglobus sp.]
MTDAQTTDVAVVGAGIIGLAAALRIALQGKQLILIDRQAPGRGCSYGNAGVIASDSIEPLASPNTLRQIPRNLAGRESSLALHPRYLLRALPWLARFAWAARRFDEGVLALRSLQVHSLSAFTSLLEDAACGNLLKPRGYLLVSEDGRNKAELIAKQRWLEARGVSSTWMGRDQLQQLAPGLNAAVYGGLYFPDTAHVVDPYRVCRSLAKAVEKAGGRILRADVRHIECTADKRFVLRTDGLPVDAGKLVIAAGAWSRTLAAQLGHRLPLDVERGYHITASGLLPELRVPLASHERHTYMTPMSDGLRITGFVEIGGTELPPVEKHYNTLQRHLRELLPSAELSAVSTWMGCRPSMPDHLPVIGRSSRYENAIFAFGHQHLGLTLSGITADIVAALIAEQPVPIDIRPFRCSRF